MTRLAVLPYHVFVAGRKTNSKTGQKSKAGGSQALVIFWLIFVVVVIGVFMLNAQTIQKNFNLFKTRITSSPNTMEEPLTSEEMPEEPIVRETPAVSQRETVREPASSKPASEPSTKPQPASDKPAGQTTPAKPEPPKPAQTRERNIYFTQIDKDGQILHSKVTRKIPVTDSPMLDALNVLLTGPSADELNRGILNLIPQNTRILSAIVRGNTAYISFSEDFLFNTLGVEGYVAQLRQIVWTVTEFSNVKDVQILIEGKRMDYLAEGIYIGIPISKQDF